MSLVELKRFGSKVEADIAMHRLENEGIPALQFDTGLNSMFGGMMGVRLMVDDSDVERAKEVLAAPPEG